MASLLSEMDMARGGQRRERSTRRVGDGRDEQTRRLRLVAGVRPPSEADSGTPSTPSNPPNPSNSTDPAELARRAAEAVARLSAALEAATARSFLHALRRGLLKETLDALIEDCERFVTVIAPDAIQSGDGDELRTHARRIAAAVRRLDMSAEEGARLPDTAFGVQRLLLRSALGDRDVQRAVAQLVELFTTLANTAIVAPPRFAAATPLRASLSRLGWPGSLVAGALAALSLVTGGLAYGASSGPTMPATGTLRNARLSSSSPLAQHATLPAHDCDRADRPAATDSDESVVS